MTNKKSIPFILFLILFSIKPLLFGQVSKSNSNSELEFKLKNAAESGKIQYKLTEPDEIKELLGKPQKESVKRDGGLDILEYVYPDVKIIFGKQWIDKDALFTLLHLKIKDKAVDIGRDKKLVLRSNRDLKKLDRFWGFQSVSLKNLDLKNKGDLLAAMPFNSLTEWPSADKLPPGFNPRQLLEEGKNPGLGIRSLHAEGVAGEGVGIAVLDQPLLLGHEEYVSRIIRYDATGLAGFPPQMHGSPVSSIAVGKDIGVAPGATLSYFAVPMWKKDNSGYIRAFCRIFELNRSLPLDEKIRVVSISDGRFASKKRYQEWRSVLKEANKKGIFVVTCDTSFMRFGTLNLIEGKDPDLPESYRPGKYCSQKDVLRIPTGNKTVASYEGVNVYTYEREGGRSWAAPYIAGLAALAFQVNPQITPEKIKELLIQTAVRTSAGPVINPAGFINRVKGEINGTN